MTEAFSDYIIFVDESGDHSLEVVNPAYPLFVLAFCIVRKDDYADRIVPAVQKLKFATFGHDMTVLHSRDIRKEHGAFVILRNPETRQAFLTGMSTVIAEAPFTLTVSAIDKPRHIAKYKTPHNPYHISLRFCLERAHHFLVAKGQSARQTHVVVESRGKVEDRDLELEFLRIVQDNDHWTHEFTLLFAPKSCNSTGLQLADLAAHPVGRHVLKPDQPNRAFDIVRGKLMTDGKAGFAAPRRPADRKNGYEGIGLKVFP
jgi:hypothetical protein